MCAQPARQPKAVPPRFEGDYHARYFARRLVRFAAPAVEEREQRVLIRPELLQWLALNSWHHTSNEPAGLAHFDNRDQRAIHVEAGQGSAQVARLTLFHSAHCVLHLSL